MKSKPEILVVDDQIPIPELGFGFPRMNAIIAMMAASDFDVTFFSLTWSSTSAVYPGPMTPS